MFPKSAFDFSVNLKTGVLRRERLSFATELKSQEVQDDLDELFLILRSIFPIFFFFFIHLLFVQGNLKENG